MRERNIYHPPLQRKGEGTWNFISLIWVQSSLPSDDVSISLQRRKERFYHPFKRSRCRHQKGDRWHQSGSHTRGRANGYGKKRRYISMFVALGNYRELPAARFRPDFGVRSGSDWRGRVGDWIWAAELQCLRPGLGRLTLETATSPWSIWSYLPQSTLPQFFIIRWPFSSYSLFHRCPTDCVVFDAPGTVCPAQRTVGLLNTSREGARGACLWDESNKGRLSWQELGWGLRNISGIHRNISSLVKVTIYWTLLYPQATELVLGWKTWTSHIFLGSWRTHILDFRLLHPASPPVQPHQLRRRTWHASSPHSLRRHLWCSSHHQHSLEHFWQVSPLTLLFSSNSVFPTAYFKKFKSYIIHNLNKRSLSCLKIFHCYLIEFE